MWFHGRASLTPGNVADITMAIPLLEGMATRRLLADKAYDADKLRNWLKERNVKAVIPSAASRKRPYLSDRRAYRRRNVIERMFASSKTGDA
ncbi:MAG: transposase [Neomegalonema sp.]|nr:transposase [Neomegalonema sp.]